VLGHGLIPRETPVVDPRRAADCDPLVPKTKKPKSKRRSATLPRSSGDTHGSPSYTTVDSSLSGRGGSNPAAVALEAVGAGVAGGARELAVHERRGVAARSEGDRSDRASRATTGDLSFP